MQDADAVYQNCLTAGCEWSFIFAASNDRLGVFGSLFPSLGFFLWHQKGNAKVLYVPFLMTMPKVTIVMDEHETDMRREESEN